MDTSVSPPAQCEINGDIEYPKKYYEFNSLDDVNQYWNDAMVFCLNTNLGLFLFTISIIILLLNSRRIWNTLHLYKLNM